VTEFVRFGVPPCIYADAIGRSNQAIVRRPPTRHLASESAKKWPSHS